jgi:Uri superfamily endonuclease
MAAKGGATTDKNHQGVYTLIIRSTVPHKVDVGRHLSVFFQRGLYLYTGSALGRGSTSLEGRIRRHLSQEKKDFWHVDRILSSGSTRVVAVVFAKTRSKLECEVNSMLLTDPEIGVLARGIGSSDCRCESHLLKARCTQGVLRRRVRSCYARLRLRPCKWQITGLAGSADLRHGRSRFKLMTVAERIRMPRSMYDQ